MDNNFKSGDIVIVNGSSISASGKKQKHHILASVCEAGKYDLSKKKFPAGELDRIFIVSKKRCQKIEISKVDTTAEIVSPKIGNLVMSLQRTFSKVEKSIGHLEKIHDVPGSIKKAEIRTSSKLVSVPFDSIIILEE
jgi:hypothetical protein